MVALKWVCGGLASTLLLLTLCKLHVQAQVAAGSCPGITSWIDGSTPTTLCTKRLCTGTYQQCMNPKSAPSATEDLVLVFSDEFETPRRNMLHQRGDKRWTAMDMYYSSSGNEDQVYKPDRVSVRNGAMHLRMDEEINSAILHDVNGTDGYVAKNYTSGMVQSWNKFCFTGGFVEFAVKLPGTANVSGLWAATWLMGNLGRAGYLRSTEGTWPYSYNECAGSGKSNWSLSPGQRINKCNNTKGRGAPEIDVLEYGIFNRYGTDDSAEPTYVHTLQMAPLAPGKTGWITKLPDRLVPKEPGAYMPGQNMSAFKTYIPMVKAGELTRTDSKGVVHWRTGNLGTDTYTASSRLNNTHFESYHTYSILWEPGEYIRWYLDDIFLFEVNKEALMEEVNEDSERIGQRLIPVEAMYLIMNLAMSDAGWSKFDPDLQFPATMSVDYVRVYQRENAINVGCNPAKYPTQEEIACNKEWYFGAAELSLWRVGICPRLTSQSNQVLLWLGAPLVFAMLAAAVATLVMAGRLWTGSNNTKLWVPTEEDISAAMASGEAGCYVTTEMLLNPGMLLQTRPDLLLIAADKSK